MTLSDYPQLKSNKEISFSNVAVETVSIDDGRNELADNTADGTGRTHSRGSLSFRIRLNLFHRLK